MCQSILPLIFTHQNYHLKSFFSPEQVAQSNFTLVSQLSYRNLMEWNLMKDSQIDFNNCIIFWFSSVPSYQWHRFPILYYISLQSNSIQFSQFNSIHSIQLHSIPIQFNINSIQLHSTRFNSNQFHSIQLNSSRSIQFH